MQLVSPSSNPELSRQQDEVVWLEEGIERLRYPEQMGPEGSHGHNQSRVCSVCVKTKLEVSVDHNIAGWRRGLFRHVYGQLFCGMSGGLPE